MDRPLPPVGLGTMGIDDPGVVTTAIDCGYRHLDTAQIYENEAVVGAGIAASDVPRGDLTVATKVWATNLAPDDVAASTRASLDRLGLDAVDLCYVHRPVGAYDPATTLPAFDRLVEEGLVRHVGVSNFTVEELATARDHLDAPIAAHQVEWHPLFHREALLADAREHGYPLVAYSPMAGGRAPEVPELAAIAEERGVSPQAVSLAWVLSHEGVVAIPKASSEAHLRANLAAADLDLTPEEIARIDAIDEEVELYPE